jgi:hypothetical protein
MGFVHLAVPIRLKLPARMLSRAARAGEQERRVGQIRLDL